jgi:hypothetical protein
MTTLLGLVEAMAGGEMPDDGALAALSPDERVAVRGLENRYRAADRWRDITLSILRTATDLSRGRDRDKVLEELVHSARLIIRSDVAYISINSNDDSDEQRTEVLTTSGVITELFRTIRMPLGVGVLGLAASTRQAAWTRDHGADPKVSHRDDVDEAVRAEGIRGILGTPLIVGGEVIGALMVGDRHPRSYTADEIVVLDSLASLAAVALETGQLIRELEENVRVIREAHDRTERQVAELAELSDTDSQLMDLLGRGGGLDGLHGLLSANLDSEVRFWRDGAWLEFDGGGRGTGVSPDREGDRDEGTDGVEELIEESRASGELVTADGWSALAVVVNGRMLGAICVAAGVDASDERRLHRASLTFSSIVLFREAIAEAETRQTTELLRKILGGAAVDEDVTRFRKYTRIDVRRPEDLYIVAIYPELRGDGATVGAHTVNRLLGGRGLALDHGDHLCVVVHAPDGPDGVLAPVISHAAEHGTRLFLGAMAFPEGRDALSTRVTDVHLRVSRLALSLREFGIDGVLSTPSTLGSLGLLLDADGPTLDCVIADGAGALVDHDARHGSELAATAMRYFDSGRNVAATAAAMYVHVNTVRQRLEKIGAVLGAGWNDGARSLDTHLALRAWWIRKRGLHRD